MLDERTIQEFLELYNEGVVDKQYYQTVFRVFRILSLEMQATYGLACITLLHVHAITFMDGERLGGVEEFMGTIREICEAIAIVFGEVNSDPAWWYLSYASKQGSAEITAVLEMLLRQVASHPTVATMERYF